MTKYMRSRHLPLKLEEPIDVKEQFDAFDAEIQDAGKALKTLREKSGWSQAQLGKKVGVSEEYLGLMESGEQPIPLIVAKSFSKLFKVDYHLFL